MRHRGRHSTPETAPQRHRLQASSGGVTTTKCSDLNVHGPGLPRLGASTFLETAKGLIGSGFDTGGWSICLCSRCWHRLRRRWTAHAQGTSMGRRTAIDFVAFRLGLSVRSPDRVSDIIIELNSRSGCRPRSSSPSRRAPRRRVLLEGACWG